MNLELAKLSFFIITLIFLIYRLFSDDSKIKNEHLFIVSSIVVTLIIIIVIYFKLHHFLRSEFNIVIISIPFLYHFYKYRSTILNSSHSFLIISLLFIGFGLLLDLLTDAKILVLSHSDFIEEILRIAGAFFWMLYYIYYSFIIRKN